MEQRRNQYIVITLASLIVIVLGLGFGLDFYLNRRVSILSPIVVYSMHPSVLLAAILLGLCPLIWFGLDKMMSDASFASSRDTRNYNKLMSRAKAKKKYLKIPMDQNGINYTRKEEKELSRRKLYHIGDINQFYRAGFPIMAEGAGKFPWSEKRDVIWVDPTDSHSLTIGTTNSGKTVSVLLPLINLVRMCGESGVIVDLKGELSRLTYNSFKKSGYRIHVLDFIEPECSDGWNPLHMAWVYYDRENKRVQQKHRELEIQKEYEQELYRATHNNTLIGFDLETALGCDENGNPNVVDGRIRDYPDYSKASEIVELVANAICKDSVPKPDIWNEMSADLLKGLIYLLLENGEPEYINLASIRLMLDVGNQRRTNGDSAEEMTILQKFVSEHRKATDLSFPYLTTYLEAAEETAKSILSTFNAIFNKFLLSQQVKNVLASNDIDLSSIDDKKTIIFLKVHDEKTTYHPLVNIFMNQLQSSLIEQARKRPNEYLKYPFNFLWDEFATFPKYEPVLSLLAAGRSRGIRLHLVIQGYDQLESKYGKSETRSIKNGCMDKAFLLSDDQETLEEISKSVGQKIVMRDGKEVTDAIFTTERLRKFQYGEVLILRQKELPLYSKLIPNDKYMYFRNNVEYFAEERPRRQARVWNLKEALDRKEYEAQLHQKNRKGKFN